MTAAGKGRFLVTALLAGVMSAGADVTIETSALKLVVGDDACAKSLVCKATGEECLAFGERTPLFASTQVRPFNNEIRLVQQAKRTAYPANRIRREGDRLFVRFETAPYEVVVKVTETPEGYVAFRVDALVSNTTDEHQYYHWNLDVPPVEAFRLLQLPVKARANFGDWLNVMWDDRVVVGVMGGTPYMDVDSERRGDFRRLTVDSLKQHGVTNGVAVLAVAPTPEAFLKQVDAMERDLGLPRGVQSRRDPRLNASIYWTNGDFRPENVDEILKYMKMGGLRMLLVYFPGVVRARQYNDLPDYELNRHWTEETLTAALARFHREGVSVGFHTLQTFIGLTSSYVTPEADHRLALLRHFTLARPLPASEAPCEIYVEENPVAAPMQVNCRFLKFGTEVFHYDGYTTERPYRFTGVTRANLKSGSGSRRVAFTSRVKAHPRGEIGGVLGISECAAITAYVDQDSSLQDEVAEKIARIYKCGFDFLYFDGSENANVPCTINISLSQYRCVEACARATGRYPLFTEGCAKSHFGWHIQSGANAFDVFGPEIFKRKIVEYPLTAAKRLAKDFTRVDFGWWGFWTTQFEGAPPKTEGLGVAGRTIGTQADMWEYGTSKAAAFDCPSTMQLSLEKLRAHARTADIFETLRRWEDVRARRWLTPAQKEMLKDPSREFHLYRNEKGGYELVEWRQLAVAGDCGSRVRAFAFERAGKRVVAYWDVAGRSKLVLAGGRGELDVADRAYWTTDLPMDVVRDAFENAAIRDGAQAGGEKAEETKP